MKISFIPVFALLASISLSMCTTEAWYEGMKRSAENECRQLPQGESENCLSRVNKKTYREYENERSRREITGLT